ncbi:24108_t:CDS:2 [Gigaspora rosea]|nr:24108_t:CDS:2 [Gigaspora rosea]
MGNLPKGLDERGIRNDEVEVTQCHKSNACDTDMDEKYMDEANSEYVEREKAIAEPKLEKEDRLVLDPGKIINENAAVGLGEIVEKNDIEGDELNIEEVFDYCDKSAGMDYEDEIIQVDKKRLNEDAEKIVVGCVNYDDFEANGNNEAREVDRMAKTSIQKKSKKELDFEARYQGDDRGGCVKKELNNRGLIDFDIETRKTAFDEYDIPVVSDDNNMISSNQGKDDEGMSSMIESDPKVARHDKEAMMEKMSGEKYKGSGKTNELLKRVLKVLMKDDTLNNVNDKIRKAEINQHNIPEWSDLVHRNRYNEIGAAERVYNSSCKMNELKALMKDKVDDNWVYDKCYEKVIDEIERNDDNRLNDTFETREAEISKNDIPDHGVENVDNRDKAPDKIPSRIWIFDEKSCHDELRVCDLESAMKTEVDGKGGTEVKSMVNKSEHGEIKSEEIELKNADFNITKHMENDHMDDKWKINISNMFKQKATRAYEKI